MLMVAEHDRSDENHLTKDFTVFKQISCHSNRLAHDRCNWLQPAKPIVYREDLGTQHFLYVNYGNHHFYSPQCYLNCSHFPVIFLSIPGQIPVHVTP
jgi:hypothetical protein